MAPTVDFDCSNDVIVITGAAGALGGAVVDAVDAANGTVAAIDMLADDDPDNPFTDADGVAYYQADLTDESVVAETVDAIVDEHGRIDGVAAIAGTWRGGDPVYATDGDVFDVVFDVNLRTLFLTAKHTLPHLEKTAGALVSVSARSSLEGGSGDALYRASKAGVRLLTESIAAEHLGEVRANAIMPSILDTPINRDMMDPKDEWVDPVDVADVILFLLSDGSTVTSGAAVPVYGEV